MDIKWICLCLLPALKTGQRTGGEGNQYSVTQARPSHMKWAETKFFCPWICFPTHMDWDQIHSPMNLFFLAALAALCPPLIFTDLLTHGCGFRAFQTKPDQTYQTYLPDLLSWPTWATSQPDIPTHLTYPPDLPTHLSCPPTWSTHPSR